MTFAQTHGKFLNMPNVFYAERKAGDENLVEAIFAILSKSGVDEQTLSNFINDSEIARAAKDAPNLQRHIVNAYWRRKLCQKTNVAQAIHALSEFNACPHASWIMEFEEYVIPKIKE